jgi:hypothetical protein
MSQAGMCRMGVLHALAGTVEHALHVLVQDILRDCAYHGIDYLPLVEEQ